MYPLGTPSQLQDVHTVSREKTWGGIIHVITTFYPSVISIIQTRQYKSLHEMLVVRHVFQKILLEDNSVRGGKFLRQTCPSTFEITMIDEAAFYFGWSLD